MAGRPVQLNSKQPIALQYLPDDILDNIGRASGSDLLALRLVCRRTYDGTYAAFCRCFIRTRIVFYNFLPSVDSIVALSRYEPLRQHVQTVLLSDIDISDVSLKTIDEVRKPDPKSKRVQNYQKTEAYLSQGLVIASLSEAFQNLPNCIRVGSAPLQDCIQLPLIKTVARDIFGKSNVQRNEVQLQKITDTYSIIGMLLAALSRSNRQLEVFDFRVDVPGVLSAGQRPRPHRHMIIYRQDRRRLPKQPPWLLLPKPLEERLLPRLQMLRCLHIGVPFRRDSANFGPGPAAGPGFGPHPMPGPEGDLDTLKSVQQLLAMVPGLTSLHLYLDSRTWLQTGDAVHVGPGKVPRPAQRNFVEAFARVKIPRLKELALISCCEHPAWFQRSSIIGIIRPFKESLRDLSIQRLCLAGSAVPLLRFLEQDTKLDKLRLQEIDEHSYGRETDRHTRFCCTDLEMFEADAETPEKLRQTISSLSQRHPCYGLAQSECCDEAGKLVSLPPEKPSRSKKIKKPEGDEDAKDSKEQKETKRSKLQKVMGVLKGQRSVIKSGDGSNAKGKQKSDAPDEQKHPEDKKKPEEPSVIKDPNEEKKKRKKDWITQQELDAANAPPPLMPLPRRRRPIALLGPPPPAPPIDTSAPVPGCSNLESDEELDTRTSPSQPSSPNEIHPDPIPAPIQPRFGVPLPPPPMFAAGPVPQPSHASSQTSLVTLSTSSSRDGISEPDPQDSDGFGDV